MLLLSATAFAASLGLAIVPFGAMDERLSGNEPWRGVDSEDSVFLLVRAQRIPAASAAECSSWVTAVERFRYGKPQDAEWGAWSPWSEDDLKSIRKCDKSPCKVKLTAAEAGEMGQAGEAARKEKYLNLVMARIQQYQATQARPGYEDPAAKLEPWGFLESKGLRSELQPGPAGEIRVRILDLESNQVRQIRQVLDQRVAKRVPKAGEAGPYLAAFWARDVYSAHYFDSWGERMHLVCDPAAGGGTLVHGLALDFDLMRKTDLISRMGRPRMRAAIRDMGARYLDHAFEGLERIRKDSGPRSDPGRKSPAGTGSSGDSSGSAPSRPSPEPQASR